MIILWNKKSIEEIKQPQEYYCSNLYCINEVARLGSLSKLLTDEAFNNYADFYCIDCIINENFI